MTTTRTHAASGFTLIELMIVAALFIIISGFIFSLFLATVRTAAAQDAVIGMRDEARLTTEKTMQLLRGAQNVTGFNAAGNNVNIGGTGARAAQLTFQYPDPGPDLLMDIGDLTGVMTLGLDLNDANGDGRTTTQIILLDGDGNVLNVLSDRAVPLNIDPEGGFIVENLGFPNFQVTVSLRSSTAGNNYPMSVTERRAFEVKN